MVLIAAVTIALAAAIVTSGRAQLTRTTVGSAWGDVPMLCDTRRFEGGDHAFELFTCRALAGRRLPPGLYQTPRDLWRSDLTGESAREDAIRITRGGALTGVAVY